MTVDLMGRTALVTGAGRGIGRAIATELARAGAAVMINDLDRDVLFESGEAIDHVGGNARAMPGDLTKPGFPEKLVQTTLSSFGSLDIIVNNAGYTWDSVIQKTTDEQFQAMLDIHAVVPFRILRAASDWIRETAKKEIGSGHKVMRKVVNITSISGMDGIAGQSGYGTGKAAVIGLTKVMAKEWGRYNVNVNAVGYGFIDTRLTQEWTSESQIDVKGEKIKVGVPAEARKKLVEMNPLGRFGTPVEAAGPVLFFCSSLSDYVTGEVLLCSGGSRV